MTGPTHVATSALALGVAILAVTVLQSAPAEARRAGAHSRIAKHQGPLHTRLVRHRLKSNKSLTGDNNTASVGNVAKTAPFNSNGGVAPINPNGGQTITSVDKIPTTHFNPNGGLPGGGNLPHTPPINPSGQPPNNPNGGQTTTTTGGGNLPHTPPIYPGGPKTMPIDPVGGPKPVPVPIDPKGGQTTTGGGNLPNTPPFNPNGGGPNASGGGQHQHAGVYADGGRGGEHPCGWLKRKYDQTGNVDWINRYRQCLSWQQAD